jgi:hypothetical protein
MSDHTTPSFDWILWLQWVMLTTLGWILGGVVFPELGLLVGGVVLGILQWAVLRQQLRQAGWWIAASGVGWALGWAMAIILLPPELGVLAGPLIGLTVGSLQWLVLRREVRRAGWWLVVSPLAWTAGLSGLLGMLLVGTAVGVITGIALELLLRYPRLRVTD